MNYLAERVVTTLARISQTEKLEMGYGNIPDDLPVIHADPLRLSQIIGNLVDNAIKYTPPHGKVTVSAGTCRKKSGSG